MMVAIACTGCQDPYPDQGVPFVCPRCGGVYDYVAGFEYPRGQIADSQPGIWRYASSFCLPPQAHPISLGEGQTPLVWLEAFGRKVGFKLEYLNPTGSFKDRGTTVMISFLRSRGVTEAVEDSSGNAGASFAAYAARAGMRAKVFVPDYAAGPKQAQIAVYGATVVRVLGPRSNAAQAVRRAAEAGITYASHAYLPFGLPGLATIAYELYAQLGSAPGTVIMPVGQGSLLLGIAHGFEALQRAGLIDQLPRLVGVQAHACAPLWAVFNAGAAGLGWVTEAQTVAEGVRIRRPVRGDAVLAAVENSQGMMMAIEESQILPGQSELARKGLFVEPTSALVWPALAQLPDDFPEPTVLILTGSGFKAI